MRAVHSLVAAVVSMGTLAFMVSAQSPPPNPPTPPPPAQSVWLGGIPGWSQHFQTQNQSGQLAAQLAKAKNEDEKAMLREKLTATLGQAFDEHMKQQQKELDDLETQIENLRSLMKKRANAKHAIVERRVDQLVQEAEGMGWSAPHASGFYNFDYPKLYAPKPDVELKIQSPKKHTDREKTREKGSEKKKDKDDSDSDENE